MISWGSHSLPVSSLSTACGNSSFGISRVALCNQVAPPSAGLKKTLANPLLLKNSEFVALFGAVPISPLIPGSVSRRAASPPRERSASLPVHTELDCLWPRSRVGRRVHPDREVNQVVTTSD